MGPSLEMGVETQPFKLSQGDTVPHLQASPPVSAPLNAHYFGAPSRTPRCLEHSRLQVLLYATQKGIYVRNVWRAMEMLHCAQVLPAHAGTWGTYRGASNQIGNFLHFLCFACFKADYGYS